MKMILTAALVAACSAAAFATAPVCSTPDNDAVDTAFASAQLDMTGAKDALQLQTIQDRRDRNRDQHRDQHHDENHGRDRGHDDRHGHWGRHHRDGRYWRWWNGRVCDEIEITADWFSCRDLAGSEGYPFFDKDGLLCLGCD